MSDLDEKIIGDGSNQEEAYYDEEEYVEDYDEEYDEGYDEEYDEDEEDDFSLNPGLNGTEKKIILVVSLAVVILILAVAVFFMWKEPSRPVNVPVDMDQSTDLTTESGESKEPESVRDFSRISKESIQVERYFYYGTHMGLNGTLSYKFSDSQTTAEVTARLYRDIDVAENQSVLEYTMDYQPGRDGIDVYMSEFIDEGLCLERIPEGEYMMLIGVKDSTGKETLHGLTDASDMEPLEYYTITHDGENRKVTIEPAAMKDDNGKEVSVFKVVCEKTELPEDVYDIVLDPGHGTCDGGAQSPKTILKPNGKRYNERDVALELAKDLKAILEGMGYKVALTRDGSEGTSSDEWCYWKAYVEGGRVWNICTPKPKYSVSLHLNSSESKIKTPGFEIYSSIFAGVRLSRRVIENVTKDTIMPVSSKRDNRVDGLSGAYKWKLSDADLDYLYVIREVGGRVTGARVADHPKYGTNAYYNVNYGPEAYLIETGYINDQLNMNVLTEDREAYLSAIARAIDEDVQSFYRDVVK